MMSVTNTSLSINDIHQAEHRARNLERPFLAVLAESSGLSQTDVLPLLAKLVAMKYVDAIKMHSWAPAFDLLPLTNCLQKNTLIFRVNNQLTAVISNPLDLSLQIWLESLINEPLDFILSTPSDINAFLSKHEKTVKALDSINTIAAASEIKEESVELLSLKKISEDNSPIVRLVNSTLYDALRSTASDIHIESLRSGITIRYRIDGVLNTASCIDGKETAEQVISRIKVLAELDIAERRIPQDGRFKISAQGREIDIRVSIMPSIHGEDAVLRILDRHTVVPEGRTLSLNLLGFCDNSLNLIRQLAAQPYGMLLVTGPTGSGKTTTLYATISEMDRHRDKIITIEDPIEYELQGVLQIPVNEKKGLTFARGLRSILRHDPDKIMVGEIRDSETAEIAVQSALTGHLVLTTVHANNVFDVFNRFTHMGIDSYALTSALNGIWAQRLMRINCQRCINDYTPTVFEIENSGLADHRLDNIRFKKGLGCGECRGSGYKGRQAIAEILVLNDKLRELISSKAPISTIKSEAKKCGTQFLREAALNLVTNGFSTLEEMTRVTLR